MGELSKEEAAKYLGCSARQIERLTSENRLGVRYVKGRAKPSPRYDEGELARFKAEAERATERPAVQVLGPERTRHDATARICRLASHRRKPYKYLPGGCSRCCYKRLRKALRSDATRTDRKPCPCRRMASHRPDRKYL